MDEIDLPEVDVSQGAPRSAGLTGGLSGDDWPDILLPDGRLDVDAILEKRKTSPRKPKYLWEIDGKPFTYASGERVGSLEQHVPMSRELLEHVRKETAYWNERRFEEANRAREHKNRFDRGTLSRAGIKAVKRPDYLIDGILVKDTLALIVGPTTVGKTFVAIDMMLCIAAGIPWQGRTTTMTKGYYIVAEGAGAFGYRVTAWDKTHPGVEEQSAAVDFGTELINMHNEQDFNDFLPTLVRLKPGFVVFDTWAKTTGGAETDSAKDTAIIYERADRIRRATGACVLFIHHPGWKEQDRVRGSYNMEASADTVLILSGKPDDIRLTVKKQKDGEDGIELRMARKTVGLGEFDPETGKELTSCIIVNQGEGDKVEDKPREIPPGPTKIMKALLANKNRMGRSELLTECKYGRNVNQFNNHVTWLEKWGMATKETVGRNVYFETTWEPGDDGWQLSSEEA